MGYIRAGSGARIRGGGLAAARVVIAIGSLRLRKPVRFAHRFASLRMTALGVAGLWEKGVCRTALCGLGLGVAVLATSLASAAQSSAGAKILSPTEQSLIAIEKSLIEAKKKDDGAFFKKTVSEEFALVGVDGKLLEGREAIDNLGDSGLVELTAYDIKVVMAGDAAGLVTYDAVVREKPEEDQGPPPRYQHFSSLWVKSGDEWKLKFQQSTSTHWGDW